MRISQIARKYDLSVQEIAGYLESLENPPKSVHPNAKLDSIYMDLLQSHFQLNDELEEPIMEPVVEVSEEDRQTPEEDVANDVNEDISFDTESSVEELSPEEEIKMVDGEIATEIPGPETEVSAETSEKALEVSEQTHDEEEVILSDQLIEMIDSEENPENLDKIKLIRAPKKKLSGLTVLDKIDIPEDANKKKKETTEDKGPTLQLTPEEKAERVRKREEYKEKRRLEAKRKKEEYEARKEKRKKEQETKKLKAIKEAHYKQKLTQSSPHKQKKHQEVTKKEIQVESRPQPKTLLGKFWRWLNT